MSFIEHINCVKETIHEAECTYHRVPGSVHILAVSKGRTITDIKHAFDAGLTDFGESYLQEAEQKFDNLSGLPINWHFIGPLQSNKANKIAHRFNWVHSISRVKIARLLNNARPDNLPPLQVCIQINFGDDPNKEGIHPHKALELAEEILSLPRLKLRGLMLIPKIEHTKEAQYQSYLRLTHLLNDLNERLNYTCDTLSMGMSEDYLAAIHAGSTIVRLGRHIFETVREIG